MYLRRPIPSDLYLWTDKSSIFSSQLHKYMPTERHSIRYRNQGGPIKRLGLFEVDKGNENSQDISLPYLSSKPWIILFIDLWC